MFKHTESGGYLTIDEHFKEKNWEFLKAYLRIFKGESKQNEDDFSSHSFFEIEIAD